MEDNRNIIDYYKYWNTDAIIADLDTKRQNYSILISNKLNDFNIGSVIRNANAFMAKEVILYGKKKFEVDTITGERRNIRAFEILDDDSPTCIHQDGVEGFDISVTRVVKLNGTEVERKTFTTHYTPEDRITCTNPEAVFGNPPPPKPKKTPVPKVSTETSTTTTPVPAQ